MAEFNPQKINCYCGAPMELKFSQKFNRYYYSCSTFPKCRGSIGAYDDGTPKGVPADDETKALRRKLFDKISEFYNYKYGKDAKAIETLLLQHTGKKRISELTATECKGVINKFDLRN